jgi:hypothetical protein
MIYREDTTELRTSYNQDPDPQRQRHQSKKSNPYPDQNGPDPEHRSEMSKSGECGKKASDTLYRKRWNLNNTSFKQEI